MTPYDPDDAYRQWQRLPVDDYGYFHVHDLLLLSAVQFADLVRHVLNVRFTPTGWRNKDSALTCFMDAARWAGKRVLDFGCGLGADSAWFAAHKAEVLPADMSPGGLTVAQRFVNCVSGRWCQMVLTSPEPPFFLHTGYDLFWSMGVLHHTPHAGPILRQACEGLNPGGECRFVVYSDRRWRQLAGCEPLPVPDMGAPEYQKFIQAADSVGSYADWYDEQKIRDLVSDFAEVLDVRYLCDGQMIGAALRPQRHGRG